MFPAAAGMRHYARYTLFQISTLHWIYLWSKLALGKFTLSQPSSKNWIPEPILKFFNRVWRIVLILPFNFWVYLSFHSKPYDWSFECSFTAIIEIFLLIWCPDGYRADSVFVLVALENGGIAEITRSSVENSDEENGRISQISRSCWRLFEANCLGRGDDGVAIVQMVPGAITDSPSQVSAVQHGSRCSVPGQVPSRPSRDPPTTFLFPRLPGSFISMKT